MSAKNVEKAVFNRLLTIFLFSFVFLWMSDSTVFAKNEKPTARELTLKAIEEARLEKERAEKEAIKAKKEKEAREKQESEEKMDQIARSKLEPRISEKWFRGNYLIYDCEDGHFACVNEISNVRCNKQRNKRLLDQDAQLGCAPLKRFSTQKECFDIQLKKLQNQVPKLFCLHPKFR